MLGMCAGDVIPMDRTLERFPMRLTPVRDFAQRSLRSLPHYVEPQAVEHWE
jgi:hypothetical protein